jgi:hypothetical protein
MEIHRVSFLLDTFNGDDVAGGAQDGDRGRVAEHVVGHGAHVALHLRDEASLLQSI